MRHDDGTRTPVALGGHPGDDHQKQGADCATCHMPKAKDPKTGGPMPNGARNVWVTATSLSTALNVSFFAESVALFERTRQDLGDFSGQVSVQRQYYISSLGGRDAVAIARYGRAHWAVENNLHWQLDVSFGEDQRRIRKGHGAENYSRLSRIALNLLKRDRSIKAGIKAKRLNAGWDHDYLLQLISG